jgi:hypothetical protein
LISPSSRRLPTKELSEAGRLLEVAERGPEGLIVRAIAVILRVEGGILVTCPYDPDACIAADGLS